MTVYLNLLEPEGLVRHFLEFLPEGFRSATFVSGIPAFEAMFDLLTTAEEPLRRRLTALPFASRMLRVRTCFAGTTVSEYALFPADSNPADVARELREVANRWPFLIVKDVPTAPRFVGEAAFEWAKRLTEVCVAEGFVIVEGQALAFVPIDFASTDEYLARLSHARRKNLRRKLRSRGGLEIEEVAFGDPRFGDDAFIDRLYALYLNVYDQSEIHFDKLVRKFFAAVLRDAAIPGFVVLYRAEGRIIGFNLCVLGNGLLIDKYIGLEYPAAHEHNLYMVSWLYNLDRAIELGLHTYVAGWTDPEIKRSLGAQFTFTRHLVRARNPVIRGILRKFSHAFESDRSWQAAHVASTHS